MIGLSHSKQLAVESSNSCCICTLAWSIMITARPPAHHPYTEKPHVPITVTLPDGKAMEGVSWQTTPMDIAASISKSLAKKVVVARVEYTGERIASEDAGLVHAEEEDEDAGVEVAEFLRDKLKATTAGELWDLTRPLEGDCNLWLLDFDAPDGRTVFWHSSAHLLGASLEQEFGVQLTHGPPTSDGFFYDAYMGADSLSNKDYPALQACADKIAKSAVPFERVVLTKEQALRLFAGNPFKVALIQAKIPDDGRTTAYRCGPLIDLCTGPHVPHTKSISAFEIIKHSGSFWLGNTANDPLQRVYAISFPDAKRMKKYLADREAAKQNSHARIGTEQELFFFHDLSPGSAFWLPAGTHVYGTLQKFIRTEYRARGFQEVITPNVFNLDLWHISGHAAHYKEHMFCFDVEGQEFGMKPMNCPGHCLMFGHRPRSYKELPLRVADFGALHRNEFSGALSGLTRVRRFQQDDAHIFCRPCQMEDEIRGALQFMSHVYSVLGLKYELNLSTRPTKALGDMALWDKAELALRHALDATGEEWLLNPGDGAFYGPKIDIRVLDGLGRWHQCATIQLDFQLPRRFKLHYLAPNPETGEMEEEIPVMVHRAILGSVERMTAILTEHYAGKWPLWLSPRQVCVLPIHADQNEYAEEVAATLTRAGLQAVVDTSSKTYNKRVREAQMSRVNFIFTVGGAEQEARAVNIRRRDTAAGASARGEVVPLSDAVTMLLQAVAEYK